MTYISILFTSPPGIVARHKKILSTELTKILQLNEDDRLRNWTSKLLSKEILVSRGINKGNQFLINPKLLKSSKLNLKPSLKTIEPHRLKALIETDVNMYPNCSTREIHKRLQDIDFKNIQKAVYQLVNEKILLPKGASKNRTYSLAIKKEIKKKYL